MNRRNFFQRVMAGIGALVGHKYLPKAKAKKLTSSVTTPCLAFSEESFRNFDFGLSTYDYTDDWCFATKLEKGILIQCCYKKRLDNSIIINWYRCIQTKDNNPNTTIEIEMNTYEQFVQELLNSSTDAKTNTKTN